MAKYDASLNPSYDTAPIKLHDRAPQAAQLEKLASANAELEQFLYTAAHDMQEPLRTLNGFSEMIIKDYQDKLDEKGGVYLKLIGESAARMQAMVVDILNYARVNKETSEPAPFDANEQLTLVLQKLSNVIESSAAKIDSAKLPEITGNAAQFAHLLQNLIGNAIKFRRNDVTPVIHIAAEEKGDCRLFSVTDNGIGIAVKDHVKIFEPFRRLHGYHDYPGTGLGLSLCRRIVENHGGEIWCHLRAAAGSTFCFTWPKTSAELNFRK